MGYSIKDFSEPDKVKAAIKLFVVPISEIEEIDNCHYKIGRKEYLIVTDDEADDLWNEELDNYIEDVIYTEIPKPYRYYFDEDAWRRDAKTDGRAHVLASYDGDEQTEEYDGETYYFYRTN